MDEQVIPNVDAGAVPANSAPESLAIAPAAASTGDEPASAAPSSTEPAEAGHTGTEAPNVVSAVVEPTTEPVSAPSAAGSDITSPTAASSDELPNAGGTTATATVDSAVTGTLTSNSAPLPVGAGTTSEAASTSLAATTDEPLHTRIAAHLEGIFQMAKEHGQASEVTVTQAAIGLKAHVGDILHKISNGMSVAEGEMVQMLEKLFYML